jgi:hypothetical protein
MTEFSEQSAGLGPKFPEKITPEQYHAAYLALLDFAADEETDRNLLIGDIWALGRQINTVVTANTVNTDGHKFYEDYPEDGLRFFVGSERHNSNGVTLAVVANDSGKNIKKRGLSIPLNINKKPAQVHWSHAFDTDDTQKVHRPITLAHGFYVANGEHNTRFAEISKQLICQLLLIIDAPDDLRVELLEANIPDSIAPDFK